MSLTRHAGAAEAILPLIPRGVGNDSRVMPGLEPGIQTPAFGAWMAGSGPAMTGEEQESVFSPLGIHGRAMETPAKKNRIAYAVFAAAGSAAVLASLFAAPGRAGIFGAALALSMAAIAIIDARSFVIPDRLTLSAFVLGLANAASEGPGTVFENITYAALRGVLLALAFYLIRAAYFRLRRRQGFGLGDVKLAAAAGAWLDWTLIPAAIEIAALAALAAYALRQVLTKRPFDRGAKLPFGLFFAPAIWLCWLAAALFSWN